MSAPFLVAFATAPSGDNSREDSRSFLVGVGCHGVPKKDVTPALPNVKVGVEGYRLYKGCR